MCKDCGGSGIWITSTCRCKDSDGGAIYEQGSLRSGCKKCSGAGICEHGRLMSLCKECGKSGICEQAEVQLQGQ